MATTRLRKAFRYPSEDDHESNDELDEEHQEKVIADLQVQDAQKNELYRKGFATLPVLAAVFFLYTFVAARSSKQRLISLLSVSSLVCSAYILYFLPIERPDKKGKRPLYRVQAEKGPVESYLLYMNAALAGLLLLAATLSWRKGFVEDSWREALPASKSITPDT